MNSPVKSFLKASGRDSVNTPVHIHESHDYTSAPYLPAEGLVYLSEVQDFAGYAASNAPPSKDETNTIFHCKDFVPWPTEVVESQRFLDQTKHERVTEDQLGILNYFNHAYKIVDNTFLLWNLETSQYNIFDMGRPIVGIAAVKSKPGVIKDNHQHLLVVWSEYEIQILNLFIDEYNLMTVTETPYLLPIELDIAKVVGAECGRIFVIASDNNVYEFIYETQAWLGVRFPCRLTNLTSSVIASFLPRFITGDYSDILDIKIDERRGLLYATYVNNDIQAWRFTAETGSPLVSIGVVTGHELVTICQQSGNEQFTIASMNPTVPAPHLHVSVDMIVVTSTGRRIQLTATCTTKMGVHIPHWDLDGLQTHTSTGTLKRDGMSRAGQGKSIPHSYERLGLVQTVSNLPSSEEITASIAYCSPGAFLVSTRVHENFDTNKSLPTNSYAQERIGKVAETKQTVPGALLCVGNEYLTTRYGRGDFEEVYSYLLDENEIIVDIREMEPDVMKTYPTLIANLGDNELCRQYFLPARKFQVLTKTGVHTIEKMRPFEALRNVLPYDFRVFSTNDSAQLLFLLCEQDLTNYERQLACEKFFDTSVGNGKAWPGRDGDKNLYFVKGLGLYMKRLIEPFMNVMLVIVKSVADQEGILLPTLGANEMNCILTKLNRLARFLQTYRWPETTFEATANKKKLEATLSMSIQILNVSKILYAFINDTFKEESLTGERRVDIFEKCKELSHYSYRSILLDESYHSLVSQSIFSMSFECLTVSNRERMDKTLDELRCKCPSFFSQSASIKLQVKHNLRLLLLAPVREFVKPEKVKQTVVSVVDRFIKNEGVDIEELSDICTSMDNIGKKHGCDLRSDVVSCCLAMAQKLQPKPLGPGEEEDYPEWVTRNGVREGNRKWGCQADTNEKIEKRQACYKLICQYVLQSDKAVEFNGAALHHAIHTDNHEFLEFLYEWFVYNPKYRFHMVALQPKEPQILKEHIFKHYQTAMKLMRSSEELEDDTTNTLLLDRAETWSYYHLHQKDFYMAATIMDNMALAEGNIEVPKRIEYLRKALSYLKVAKHIMCKESKLTTFDDWVSIIVDRIKLAELQIDISSKLEELIGADSIQSQSNTQYKTRLRRILHHLQWRLCDVSEVWDNVLTPLCLNGLCLRVMALSEHKNQTMVFKLWSNLVQEANDYSSFVIVMNELAEKLKDTPYFAWEKIIELVHTRWGPVEYNVQRRKDHLYESIHDNAGISYYSLLRAYDRLQVGVRSNKEGSQYIQAIMSSIMENYLDLIQGSTIHEQREILDSDACGWMSQLIDKLVEDGAMDSIPREKLTTLRDYLKDKILHTFTSKSKSYTGKKRPYADTLPATDSQSVYENVKRVYVNV
eukprot:CFRG0690T1